VALNPGIRTDDPLAADGRWSRRALDVARFAAIFTAVAVPASTGAASFGSALFVVALLVSGRLHCVALEAWRSVAGKGILAFLVWITATAFYSPVGPAEGLNDLWAWRKLVYLYFALPLFADPRWKHRAVLALVVVAALGGLVSYGLHFAQMTGRGGNVGVIFTNHSIQGIAFVIAAACALWLAREAQGGRRWLYVLVGAGLVVNVLFFGTGRTAYLAVVGVTLCAAILAGGWRASVYSAAALVVLIVAAFALSPTFSQRIALVVSEAREAKQLTRETSIGVRVVFGRNTLALISERPVFGYGLGSFKPLYADYVDARYTGAMATHSGDPHNQYLYVTFEHGLVGLVVFLAMIGALYRSFPKTPYGVLAACALTAWVIGSVFNSHFRTFPEGHFFAFMVAILGGAAPRPDTGRT
jgi:O-antigen ligase